jgi:hypothetical protein
VKVAVAVWGVGVAALGAALWRLRRVLQQPQARSLSI